MADASSPTIAEIQDKVAPAQLRQQIERLSTEGAKLNPATTVDHTVLDKDAMLQAVAQEKTEEVREQISQYDPSNMKHQETACKVKLPTAEDIQLEKAVQRNEKLSSDLESFKRDELKKTETKVTHDVIAAE